jgi:hypothetical protein
MQFQVELSHSFGEWVANSHSCDFFIHYTSPV